MKKIKQLLLIGLALTFILSSCSMEKRHYMSGYHIQWKNAPYGRHELASNNIEKKITENKTTTAEQLKMQTNTIDSITTTADANITASADNSVVPLVSEPTLWRNNPRKAINRIIINPTPTEFKSNNNKKRKTHKALTIEEEGENKNLSIVGLVLGILGCVGYYAGPLFGLAAIIVSAIALKKIKREPKEYGGKTMATIGLILGIVAVIAWTIVIALLIATVFMA